MENIKKISYSMHILNMVRLGHHVEDIEIKLKKDICKKILKGEEPSTVSVDYSTIESRLNDTYKEMGETLPDMNDTEIINDYYSESDDKTQEMLDDGHIEFSENVMKGYRDECYTGYMKMQEMKNELLQNETPTHLHIINDNLHPYYEGVNQHGMSVDRDEYPELEIVAISNFDKKENMKKHNMKEILEFLNSNIEGYTITEEDIPHIEEGYEIFQNYLYCKNDYQEVV